ncbi:hypothetical protein EON80_19230 [bacterium]|nr:MAG: hypothetical protein EON80_19230 [bacterium]
MVIKVLWRPLGFFGIGALFFTFAYICALFSFSDEASFLPWVWGLMTLELLRQVVAFYYVEEKSEVKTSSKIHWNWIGLCLASFLFPPVGLFVWLSLDKEDPEWARRAGRFGVRGALLFLIAGWVLFMNSQVAIAIKAIEYAQIKPVNEAKAEKIIAQKKRARAERRAAEKKILSLQ